METIQDIKSNILDFLLDVSKDVLTLQKKQTFFSNDIDIHWLDMWHSSHRFRDLFSASSAPNPRELSLVKVSFLD